MPAPIHPDYNFKVNHKKRDNHYSMNTAASYENMYGIGYMISGDRIIITPQKTHIEHRLVTPAGDRYGIRYEEALALEAAYQRWRMDKLEAALIEKGVKL